MICRIGAASKVGSGKGTSFIGRGGAGSRKALPSNIIPTAPRANGKRRPSNRIEQRRRGDQSWRRCLPGLL
jgi:hypothetical protein